MHLHVKEKTQHNETTINTVDSMKLSSAFYNDPCKIDSGYLVLDHITDEYHIVLTLNPAEVDTLRDYFRAELANEMFNKR